MDDRLPELPRKKQPEDSTSTLLGDDDSNQLSSIDSVFALITRRSTPVQPSAASKYKLRAAANSAKQRKRNIQHIGVRQPYQLENKSILRSLFDALHTFVESGNSREAAYEEYVAYIEPGTRLIAVHIIMFANRHRIRINTLTRHLRNYSFAIQAPIRYTADMRKYGLLDVMGWELFVAPPEFSYDNIQNNQYVKPMHIDAPARYLYNGNL